MINTTEWVIRVADCVPIWHRVLLWGWRGIHDNRNESNAQIVQINCLQLIGIILDPKLQSRTYICTT